MPQFLEVKTYGVGGKLVNIDDLFTGRVGGDELDVVGKHLDEMVNNGLCRSLTLVILRILYTSLSLCWENLDRWES